MNEIAEKMKKCWENPFATQHDPRLLLKLGSEEIERLETIIKSLIEEIKKFKD